MIFIDRLQRKHNVDSYKGKNIFVSYDCQRSEGTGQRKKYIEKTSDPDEIFVEKSLLGKSDVT